MVFCSFHPVQDKKERISISHDREKCHAIFVFWRNLLIRGGHIFSEIVRMRELQLVLLKVHKIENFFDIDFGICVISFIFMSKY
jgi:hypothetical protein